jgi:serine/threonine-protein kinase
MRFELLGTFEVRGEDGPLALGGRKQRLVLVHLLLRRNQVVPADVLIDQVWDEEPPDAARSSVQAYVSNLRRLIGAERLEGRPPGYVLHAGDDEVDAARFESLVADGRDLIEVDAEEAARTLAEALTIWRGPALSDLADERSLFGEIARLGELRLSATEHRITAELALGRHQAVVAELEALTFEHPLRERLWSLRMLALYRSHRQAEALEAYAEARRVLADQLGIDPSRSLQRLHERILGQDPALSVASRIVLVAPSPAEPATPAGDERPRAGRELEVGSRLGSFRILSVLGRGGMSVVYLAEHEGLKRRVALKLLGPTLADDDRFRDRFVRESQLAASLDHPHVITIFEAGEADGHLYIAMQYVDGTDLRRLLREAGRLDAARTLAVLRQTADALDAAHARGLVHRDVKPGNVLIARGGGSREQVFLTDFGLTKRATSHSGVTGTGQFIGTVDYAAPEQFEGKPLDSRADVYSLGAVLFECLAGHPPFVRDHEVAIMHAHLMEAPPRVTDERPELPGAIDGVIARAMSKDPADRYRSAGDLGSAAAAALEPIVGGAQLRTFLVARAGALGSMESGDAGEAELVRSFASIARAVIDAHEGVVQEVRGLEAVAVFASSRQAIRAATELDQSARLVNELGGLSIGLDAGEAFSVEGAYRGPALELATGLCEQARPGIVLASEAVVHLAGTLDGVAHTAPKSFKLKGLAQPVRAVETVPVLREAGAQARSPRRRKLPGGRRSRIAVASMVAVALLLTVIPLVRGGSDNALAALPSGMAIIDSTTGEELGFVSHSAVHTPADVTFAEGHFWVLNLDPISFVEIDPADGEVLRQIASPTSDVASYVVTGKNLWVAGSSEAAIWRVDLGIGRAVDRFDLADQASSGIGDVVEAFGSLWVLLKDLERVIRLNPDTGKIEATVREVFLGRSITSTGDELLAVGDAGVFEIDPATNKAQWAGGSTFGSGPSLAVNDQYVWSANEQKGVLFRVLLHKHDIGNTSTVETGSGARSVSLDAGVVWVGNQDAGTVSGVDADLSSVVRTFRFGHPIQSIAAGAGALLVQLNEGRPYDQRIAALSGDVARLLVAPQQLDRLDPATTTTLLGFQVEYATCGGLLGYPDADGSSGAEVVAEAAAGLPIVSEDGRTYTFTIRPGFRFSPPSGEDVTAETFRYSIERALSPRMGVGALGAQLVDMIEGEDAFRAGEAEHISGLVAQGDTLTITLTRPTADFVERLATPFFCPVPSGTPVVPGGAVLPTGRTLVDRVPSAGPYYISEHLAGEYTILSRNPNYGGSRPRTLDTIALREGLDPFPAAKQVEAGAWDGITTFSEATSSSSLERRFGPDGTDVASTDPRFVRVAYPSLQFVALNTSRPLFADADVRRAAALALAGLWREQTSEPATSRLLPPTFAPADTAEPYSLDEADLARAQRLMDGRTGTAVMFGFKHCGGCNNVAAGMVTRLFSIGIDLKVKQVVDPYAATRAPGAEVDLALSEVYPFLPDRPVENFGGAASFLQTALSEPVVPAGWVPDSVVHDLASLDSLFGPERNAAARRLAARLATDAVPIVAFGYATQADLVGASLGCDVHPPFSYGVDLAALCPA